MFMMASCSKNQPQAPDPDAWVSDLSLPVPIQFGGTSLLETKGYETASDLNGAELGVVGIARNWEGNPDDNILLNNVKGSIAAGIVSLEGGTRYYPRESDKNYSFYGYCPYADAAVSPDGSVVVPITGMGKKDILWAKAEASGNGYNAKYIRQQRASGGQDYPTFEFVHVTSCLEFKAVANTDDGHNTDSDFTNIEIRRVTLKNVCATGDLCVAGPQEGTIVNLGGERSVHSSPLALNPTIAGTSLGTFYAYPDPALAESFEVEVVFYSPANGQENLNFKTGKLEPRTKYLYKLNFNKVDDIKIYVTGVRWESELENSFEVDDLMNPATSEGSEEDETQDEPVTPEP